MLSDFLDRTSKEEERKKESLVNHYTLSDKKNKMIKANDKGKAMFDEFCSEIGVSFEDIAFLNGSFTISATSWTQHSPLSSHPPSSKSLDWLLRQRTTGQQVQGKDTNPADVNDIRAS